MELLHTTSVSDIRLFELRISEGELQNMIAALDYILKKLDESQIHAVFTPEGYEGLETPAETREFLEEMLHELSAFMHS